MRFAFFNIQSGVGVTKGYFEYALLAHKYLLPHDDRIVSAVAKLTRDLEIDVLACAEMEGASSRSSNVDYAARIAERSPLVHHAFFPSHRVGRWVRQGNSIHARRPLASTRVHALPGAGEPRVLGEAVLGEGEEVTVFVTHLSLGKKARALQIAHISETACKRPHAVLMGDFNTADVAEIEPMVRAGWMRAPLGATHPSWRPSGAIDHVLVSPDLRIEGARVIAEVLASDHLPVIVDIVRA